MKQLVLIVLFYCICYSANAQETTAWQYYKEIKLNTSPNGANVSGDVKDFPLAITLTAKNFDFSQAKANGADIRFSNGTVFLPHSIEWWDLMNKKALVWVNVPFIKGNNATQAIYMHWGNATAEEEDHSTEIFAVKEGFVGVWHLNEPGNTLPEGYKDATGNEANASGVNMRPGSLTDGIIGKAQQFNYPDKQWIKVDTDKRKLFDLTRQVTFSIWAKARSYGNVGDEEKRVTPGYETMIAKGDNSWRLQKFGPRHWHKPAADLIEICVEKQPKGDLCVVGKTDMVTGKWFHLTGVHDFPYVKLYVNGVLDTVEKFDVEWKSDDHPVGIGNQSQFPDKGGRFWDGLLDEARVLKVAKNEHWIRLDYESQREGSVLLTFGKTQKR